MMMMMTDPKGVQEIIQTAIRNRAFIHIAYRAQGTARIDVLEPYTLGHDHNGQLVLAGFHWATDSGPTCTGRRSYFVEDITSVEIFEYDFGHAYD